MVFYFLKDRIKKNMTHLLHFTKTHSAAITPTRFEDTSSGYDLFSIHDVLLSPQTSVSIDTGLVFNINGLYFGQIMRKNNNDLFIVIPSVIDGTQKNSVHVYCYNPSLKPHSIFAGDKIAQILFIPFVLPKLIRMEDLDDYM